MESLKFSEKLAQEFSRKFSIGKLSGIAILVSFLAYYSSTRDEVKKEKLEKLLEEKRKKEKIVFNPQEQREKGEIYVYGDTTPLQTVEM